MRKGQKARDGQEGREGQEGVVSPFAKRDSFEDESFAGLTVAKADLSGREFVRCTFTHVVLPESDWSDTRVEDCRFEGCDLTRLRMIGTAMRGAEFVNCRLTGVDWSQLRPNPTLAFDECNLQYSSFVKMNLTGTRFTRSRLTDVNFLEARLVETAFPGSDLTGCRFEDCDARGADFSSARGVAIDPARNRLTGARVALDAAVLIVEAFGLRVDGYERR